MFDNAVITTDGLELDTKIRAGLAVPTFTHIRLGDGKYDDSEDLCAASKMQSVRQTFEISSIVKMDNKTVRLRVVADNSGITEGYFISEIGVFALDPDKGEILYSIALGVDGKMDYQPSETELAGATSTFDMFTSVSNVDTAQIVIGTGAAASALDLAEAEERIAVLIEQLKNSKVNIVVMKDGDIPVAEREKNAWYLKVTNVQSYRSMRAGPGGLAARIIGEEDEAWQNH